MSFLVDKNRDIIKENRWTVEKGGETLSVLKKPFLITCIFISICVSVVIYFLGASHFSMLPYYKDTSNYETHTITIIGISYDDDFIIIHCDLGYEYFTLSGRNHKYVINQNIESNINNGDQVIIVTALAYFGDGYTYPIVGIEKNGVTYLDSEQGIENLLVDLARERIEFFGKIALSLGAVIFFIFMTVRHNKKLHL
jgi:hypothetical protein